MFLESKGIRYHDCSVSFVSDGQIIEFKDDNTKNLFKSVVDWLYKSGYNFSGPIHTGSSTKIFTEDEVNDIVLKSTYEKRMFYNISGSGKFIAFNSKVKQLFGFLTNMLVSFGVNEETIKFEGLGVDKFKVKKFGEMDLEDDVELDELEDPIETEIENTESIDKVKIFSKNPFRQSICVLGDPGAGKSTTVRKILRSEGYKFQIWEPSAATTGLLAQFTPLKGYIPSRVGSMMIAASKDPEKLYTFVIEEAHKSSIIEMINDELKHAISLRRFEGDRFVPYEDSTSYLAEYLEEDDGGNLKVPDNFGFIFISSKPKVIANNGDIFDRLDIILLKHYEEEKIQSVSELLSKVLSPEEKIKLKATRND